MSTFVCRISGLWLVALGLALSGCPTDSALDRLRGPDVEEPSPILAQVGQQQLRQADLAPLAEAARQLRQDFDLPVPAEAGELELAVELLSLAEMAREHHAEQASEVRDLRRRLLSRLFLRRLMDSRQAPRPDEADLLRLHRLEVEKFAHRGQSDIYEPTRVSSALISIGRNPDFRPPHASENVLDSQQVEELAAKLRGDLGERVESLDEFLALGRGWSENHPSLRLQVFDALELGASAGSEQDRMTRAALATLDGNGAISQPLLVPEGAIILRRGATLPGRGESLEAARDDLLQRFEVEQQRRLLRGALDELFERLRVQVFADRLQPAPVFAGGGG